MGKGTKIVWGEVGEVHSAKGYILGEDPPGFVKVQLYNGTILSIARHCILKLEDVSE